jgi:hypothetical protein
MTTNVIFPGRPDYTGPISGPFGAVHHDTLCEESHNINERLAYIDGNKPPHEIPIRRWNMIYLGGCPAVAARNPLRDQYVAAIKALHQYDAARKLLDDQYYAAIKALLDQYYAAIKPLRDQYDAANKLLDDQYVAAIKPLLDQYYAARKPLDDQYNAARKPLDDQYNAAIKALHQYDASCKPLDAEILAYIRTHIPDFPWDGKELVMK